MKANLLFSIYLDHDRTSFAPLKEMAKESKWDTTLKKYVWTFPLIRIKDVRAVLGKSMEFDDSTLQALFKESNQLQEIVSRGKVKGEGYTLVTEFPKLYKVEGVINGKPSKFNIDKETVKRLWKVMSRYPVKKAIKTSTISEHYCNELGITRFHRESSTFDYEKFNGTRKTYFQFYYSLKVLVHLGLIKHYKSGKAERLKEAWVEQDTIQKGNI